MKFHAQEASCSVAGDYYQLYFGPKESDEDAADPFESKGPYLVIQRQFEMFDRGRCRIESDSESYFGDFHLELIEVSATLLSFEIKRQNNRHVNITFALGALEFEQVRRVVEVIFGLNEQGDEVL